MKHVKLFEDFIKESYYEFDGVMLKDLKVGGKSNRYPFSDTPEVILKKGDKVTLVIQNDLYQFLNPKDGKMIGSIWQNNMRDKIYDVVNYK